MESVLQSLNNIYITLNQLDIKATPNNTMLLAGVYQELEKCMKVIQRVGDKNEWKQEDTKA